MNKVNIDTNAFPYPMPMVLVGAMVDGKANFLAVAWVTRVGMRPPLIAVALGPHHTNAGIEEHGQFSVNIPDVALLEKTDYCGLVSGKKVDKSALFDVHFGKLAAAPLIGECPLSMACRLFQKVDLPHGALYLGEIVEAFCEEGCMSDGKPDITRMRPFTLTMPDNGYWTVGERVGSAWSSGRNFGNE